MVDSSEKPLMRKLQSGRIDLCHYKGILRETYHNAGLNPQLQAFATIYFEGRPRALVKRFYQHSISEIGHDLMALGDLEVLGVSKNEIINSKPLPITQAFFANTVWGIQTCGPLYYLGYLFHLEFTPTENGRKYIEMLKLKGVPEEAMTFLEEHATVDVAHNKLMEGYISELVKTQKDADLVIESLRCSVDLHTSMLEAAANNGELLYGQKAA